MKRFLAIFIPFVVGCASFGDQVPHRTDYDNCASVPTEILFRFDGREIKRFENYGKGLTEASFKNPEHAAQAGPATGRNCTIHPTRGATYNVGDRDVQHVRYKFKTAHYFDAPDVSDHIATATRSYLYREPGVWTGWQRGIGIALYGPHHPPGHQGLYAEYFSTSQLSHQTDFVPHDGKWYTVDIESRAADEAVVIEDEAGERWAFSWRPNARENSAGWAIGIIIGKEEDMAGFEVHVTDLRVSWDWAETARSN